MNISSSRDQPSEQVTPQMYLWSDSDLEDGFEIASETGIVDEDPFEDFLDVDDSVADKLQYDRSPCLPCIDSNLKCDEALPTCGSCDKSNVKCRRVRDTHDRPRKGTPQPRFRLSHAEAVSPTVVGRGPRHRVYELLEGSAERLSQGQLAASSTISHESDPPRATSQRSAIHPPVPDLHPPLRDSQDSVSLEELRSTLSVTKETLSPRLRRRPDSEGIGSAISNHLVLNSGDSDSAIDGPQSLAQREAFTSKTDVRDVHQLAHSSKATSSSDNTELSRHTGLLKIKNSACDKCRLRKRHSICVHHVVSDDRAAIAPLDGKQSVRPSANEQPTIQGIGNDDDSYSKDKVISITPIDVETPASAMGGSFSVDHSHPPKAANFDMPISRSQDTHFAPRLPAASGSQATSSEDSDPPINPSQRRQHRRPKNTDTPHARLTAFHRNETQKPGTAVDEGSDSDAPLVPSWKKAGRKVTPKPVNHRVNGNDPQAKGGESPRDTPWGPQSQQPLLGDPLTNAPEHTTRKDWSSIESAGHHKEQHHDCVAPQTRKPIVPVRISRSALPLINNGTKDDISAEYEGRPLETSKARQQQPKKIRPNATLCNSAIKSAKQRPKFGLKDIIPEAGPSKRPNFGLKDIVPKAQTSTKQPFTLNDVVPSKEPTLPRGNPELKIFHDALRMSFAPFLTGPESILNAPVKKRKFTLADVAGMPQEPLFDLESVIEEYLAHPDNQEQRIFKQTTDQAQSAEAATNAKQEVSSTGEDTMSLHSNDIKDKGRLLNPQYMVESASDRFMEPNWTKGVNDAESFLAGTWNGATVKEAKD